MSIKHYRHVWQTYPGRQGSHKFVFLALADFANDETDECWPSIATLADMVGLTERRVQMILRDLEKSGDIEIQTGHGRRNTNIFKIILGKGEAHFTNSEKKGEANFTLTDAEKVKSGAEKVKSGAEKVKSGAEKGEAHFTRSVIEPPIEPPIEPEEEPPSPVIDGAAHLMDLATRKFENRQRNGGVRQVGWQAELNKKLAPAQRTSLVEALAKACGLTAAMVDDTIFRDLHEYAVRFNEAGYRTADTIVELKNKWMSDDWKKTNHPMPSLVSFFKFASQMAEKGVMETVPKQLRKVTIRNQYTDQLEERYVNA